MGNNIPELFPEHRRQHSGIIKRQQYIFVSDSIYVLLNIFKGFIHLVCAQNFPKN